MAGSPWALAALIVYPAIQIPLVLYLARWFEIDRDAPIPTPTRTYWDGEADRAHPLSGWAGACPRCGSENDPAYTFCRSCVARL